MKAKFIDQKVTVKYGENESHKTRGEAYQEILKRRRELEEENNRIMRSLTIIRETENGLEAVIPVLIVIDDEEEC